MIRRAQLRNLVSQQAPNGVWLASVFISDAISNVVKHVLFQMNFNIRE